MSSLLAKSLSSLSPSSLSCHTHHLNLLFPLLRLSLSTQSQPQKEVPFIAQYLISSFGFSLDRALKVSNDSHLAGIRSPDRPEAVIQFLKDTGFSDSQTQAVVSFYPLLLSHNVEKTLKPKVQELRENGFSEELLVQLIRYNPGALYLKDTLSRLLFWKDFVGNSDQKLLRVFQRNHLLINFDIDKCIIPIINLLKNYGLSHGNILALLWQGTNCIRKNLDSLRQILDLIEELGIPRGSKMYRCGLKAVGNFTRDKILKKVEFFKVTYGWSEDEVSAAFKRSPNIFILSEETVKSKMGFLTSNAKLDPRKIALTPVLLTLSLERRLAPRHYVVSILEEKGLKKESSFISTCVMSEKVFLEKFVVPYRESVPEVAEAYPTNVKI